MPDVPLTVQDNLLTVRLSGNELADDPLQQDGLLYNMLVTVDMGDSGTNAETGEPWVGTPLANLAAMRTWCSAPSISCWSMAARSTSAATK